MLTNEKEVLSVIEKILNSYTRVGAEFIVTACPLCHLNLEIAKTKLSEKLGLDKDIPIIYFTQLIGFSFNIPIEELGISKTIAESLDRKIALTVTARGEVNG